MRLKWLGHASFLITSQEGVRIITDPYQPSSSLYYQAIDETAEIMLVSHQHGNHAGGKVRGNPEVVSEAGTKTIKGLEFKGLATFHDESGGRQRGSNTVFCFSMDGVKICHLGDLGHQLTESQIAEMEAGRYPDGSRGGGYYTIDAKGAARICEAINPRVVIPMHFKNEKCALNIAGVEEFTRGKENLKRMNASEVEFRQGELPAATEIVLLNPAL